MLCFFLYCVLTCKHILALESLCPPHCVACRLVSIICMLQNCKHPCYLSFFITATPSLVKPCFKGSLNGFLLKPNKDPVGGSTRKITSIPKLRILKFTYTVCSVNVIQKNMIEEHLVKLH